MDGALRPHGLTTPQYAVLEALREAAGLSGAELARRAFVSPQTMNDIVVGLERLGLVDRKPHPTHGRVLQANLTPAGLRLVTEAHGQVLAIEAEMIGDLSTEERSILFALLGRCADRLEDTARSGDEQADGARTTAGTSGGRRRRSAS
jgi:DNA-binding MarR family transcriptional regulator